MIAIGKETETLDTFSSLCRVIPVREGPGKFSLKILYILTKMASKL